MSGGGFTVFPTSLGHCGLAWTRQPTDAVVGSQLPETDAASTRTRLRTRFPDAIEHDATEHDSTEHGGTAPAGDDARTSLPTWVAEAIEAVRASLAGKDVDLSTIPLDLRSVPPFHARVYELARTIPRGTTTTYGELARRLGEPGAAQAVGQALGANPFAPIVPCHRILAAGGKPGGFSATGGLATKERILETEGVHLTPPTLF
ncbi:MULTISPECIES: methylated-DNA--[protein]-cysteine S-methyltransferase [Prauserella salsuginis group]|uniref:Methylated-DNA--[protein]-cysteine S-methyltransferase n=1 Tax=Prauserella salsuginis TaxID=387889 RepID=A0ABW6G6E3_9PSEU|nr:MULTISPECIES: MGMT family protein [Prauserella salsuginis group]MCR3722849.1 methylated-DNA-[protein]-cysteine S-methyltransferase [Prauserella flava]MCR3737096.1 methylated-DNA-[protein]-cysteine S-methyltransferase [Prauserella salsuginis]